MAQAAKRADESKRLSLRMLKVLLLLGFIQLTSKGRRRLPCQAMTQRPNEDKKSGTKKIARKVAASIPPNTPVPIEFRLAAPAPVAMTSGTTPKMKAMEVMTIGRNRSLAGFNRASAGISPPHNVYLRTRRSEWHSSPTARSG